MKRTNFEIRKWTETEEDFLCKLFNSGITYKEIGRILDRSEKSVACHVKRINRRRRNETDWDSEELTQLLSLRENGFSMKEIGKILHRSEGSIKSQLYIQRHKGEQDED